MLYILTGEMQTGKTRWLQAFIDYANEQGVEVHGILTPGVWEDQNGSFIKKGINMVLMPDRAEYAFALPQHDERTDLGWTILDTAVYQANSHLRDILHAIDSTDADVDISHSNVRKVLIIDEIGPLEFSQEKGFINALKILQKGPSAQFEHVIVIVRPSLVDLAKKRFESAWGSAIEIITPQSDFPAFR